MPIYHFNVHDGVSIPDPEGTELPDLQSARKAAVQLCGALLTEQAEAFWNEKEWSLDVCDHSGLILFKLTFFATDTAATMHR